MNCPICESASFGTCEYTTLTARCAALECTVCHAIVLHESAAHSADECGLVREMMAVRARVCVGYRTDGASANAFAN